NWFNGKLLHYGPSCTIRYGYFTYDNKRPCIPERASLDSREMGGGAEQVWSCARSPIFYSVGYMNASHEPANNGDPLQHSSATPRSLLERVKSSEAGAWERLVELYAPLVHHWCRRWELQDQDRADILQEVFHAVVMHIGDFRKETERDTFRGWLRR